MNSLVEIDDETVNDELSFDKAIQDNPFFHACRQNHEDHLEQIFRWIGIFARGLRNSLEESSCKQII